MDAERRCSRPASIARRPAALHDLRQRRRRQIDADRPAAYDSKLHPRRPDGGARGGLESRRHARAASSISRCWSTACGRARAGHHHRRRLSLSSRRDGAASSSPTRPGHEQYTRNMVTGASTADLAVMLVDARKGVLDADPPAQLICLAARHPARRAGGQQDGPGRLRRSECSKRSRANTATFAAHARLHAHHRHPDVGASTATTSSRPARDMPWYRGPTLLRTCWRPSKSRRPPRAVPFRMPVQWVNRPNHDFRGYAGTIASGTVRPGDAIVRTALGPRAPRRAHRHRRRRSRQSPAPARCGDADAGRRDRCQPRRRAGGRRRAGRRLPTSSRRTLIWMDERRRCCPGRSYLMKIGTAHGRRRPWRPAQAQDRRRHAASTRRAERWRSTRSASANLELDRADRVRTLRATAANWAASS